MKIVKSSKSVLKVLLVSTALMVMVAQSAFAVQKSFTKANVDSNTFNAVSGTTGTKVTAVAYPQVYIDAIYKADGSDSNYKKVRFKVMHGTTQATILSTQTVAKGDLENLPLTSQYQKVGVSLTLHAMGNDPALDCQITGYFEPA